MGFGNQTRIYLKLLLETEETLVFQVILSSLKTNPLQITITVLMLVSSSR
jgi:hypothetical protein